MADLHGKILDAGPLSAVLFLPTYLRQGNIFTPVSGSVHRDVCVWQTPSQADTPLSRHPPPPPRRRPLQQTVRVLLECILDFIFMQF